MTTGGSSSITTPANPVLLLLLILLRPPDGAAPSKTVSPPPPPTSSFAFVGARRRPPSLSRFPPPTPPPAASFDDPPRSAPPPPSLSRSSHETFGDGALSAETFAELYGRHPANESSAATTADEEDDGDGPAAASRPSPHFLPKWLTDRCDELGWTHPTLVQRRSLDAILTGPDDVVIQSQTGSGKTLAYLLPLLSSIDPSRSAVQAMVVVPTRELGLQVSRVAKRLAAGSGRGGDADADEGRASRKIAVMSVLQGSKNRRQRAWAWSDPPHVVVGTPSELTEMAKRGGMKCNAVKFVVVDEVDACLSNNANSVASTNLASSGGPLHELLSRHLSPTYDEADPLSGSDGGGVEATSALLTASAAEMRAASRKAASRRNDRRTVFASATIPQRRHFVRQCAKNAWTTREPVRVCVTPGELVPPSLRHAYVVCAEMSQKLTGLRRTIKREAAEGRLTKALIFCDPSRPLEQMAAAIARDLNGIVLSDGHSPEKEDGADAVVSVLRYEDHLGKRADAMRAFGGSVGGGAIPAAADDDEAEAPDEDSAVAFERGSRDDKVRIMLSTDLAARGLDVPYVSHVVNFDLPRDGDSYVHRGGRAGRMGRPGTVLSLIVPEQEFVLERLANELGLDVRCVARQRPTTKTDGSKKGGRRKTSGSRVVGS